MTKNRVLQHKFYLSLAWKQARGKKLREQPECEYCLAVKKHRPASCVDHYIPLSKGGEALAMSNLKSSCHSCHSKKTQGTDINGGIDVLKRGCDSNGIPRNGWNNSCKISRS